MRRGLKNLLRRDFDEVAGANHRLIRKTAHALTMSAKEELRFSMVIIGSTVSRYLQKIRDLFLVR